MANAVNWFEIPVSDFQRAEKFYNTILAVDLVSMEASEGYRMGMFPAEAGVGGALMQGEGYVPSAEGTIVYLNGGDDLSIALNRVEAAGGQVIVPKTSIGENGYFAFFMDTEGNKVGLHSMG